MKVYFYSCLMLLSLLTACAQPQQKKEDQKAASAMPKLPYNLDKPEVFAMPPVLNEISGIDFLNGNADTVYAEQDEEGKLFRLHLGSEEVTETKFGKKGDFEDVQLCNGYVVMLRSDGVLFTFPLSQVNEKKVSAVTEWYDVLPGGEYEGLYADKAAHKLYVLCKHCNEKKSVTNTGYIFSLSDKGELKPLGNFEINVKDIISRTEDKINFKPSALAKNTQTGEWFVLSSVNKLLVVTNADWQVKAVYQLDGKLYNQPEGIAFDKDNNLYISNEKGSTDKATILKMVYQK